MSEAICRPWGCPISRCSGVGAATKVPMDRLDVVGVGMVPSEGVVSAFQSKPFDDGGLGGCVVVQSGHIHPSYTRTGWFAARTLGMERQPWAEGTTFLGLIRGSTLWGHFCCIPAAGCTVHHQCSGAVFVDLVRGSTLLWHFRCIPAAGYTVHHRCSGAVWVICWPHRWSCVPVFGCTDHHQSSRLVAVICWLGRWSFVWPNFVAAVVDAVAGHADFFVPAYVGLVPSVGHAVLSAFPHFFSVCPGGWFPGVTLGQSCPSCLVGPPLGAWLGDSMLQV